MISHIFLLSFFQPTALYAQTGRIERAEEVTKPWVTVALPAAAEGDSSGEVLAGIIADNIELTLHLTGRYVVLPRPEGVHSLAGAAEAARLAESARLDYVVFGRVERRANNSTLFNLQVYSRENEGVSLERRAEAPDLLDTFDAADDLAEEVLEAFTGQRIAYGTLVLTNMAEESGEYEIYLDGTAAGRNIPVIDRVLVGERVVEVVALEGPAAGRAVAAVRTTVTEGAKEELSFYLAAPEDVEPPEEFPEEKAGEAVVEEDSETLQLPDTDSEGDELPEEAPLKWRIYPWDRGDYRGRRITTSSFDVVMEDRSWWEDTFLGWGLTTRMDWGNRSSFFWEYNRLEINYLGHVDSDDYIDSADIDPETVFTYVPTDAYSIAAGYGYRFQPFSLMTIIPSIRIGLEGGGYEPSFKDSAGIWQPFDTETDYFWSFLIGPSISGEVSAGAFSLRTKAGFKWNLPFERDYSKKLELYSETTDSLNQFTLEGIFEPAWGWQAGLGIAYSWGGDDEVLGTLSDKQLPYNAHLPGERSPWALSAAPSFGVPFVFAPGVNRVDTLLRWPSLAIAFEYFRTGDRYIELTAFVVPPLWREVTSIENSSGDISYERAQIDVISGIIGAGTRKAAGDNLFLKTGYNVSPFDLSSYHSYGIFGIRAGSHLSLERSFPGSAAMVFASMDLLSTLPIGKIPRSVYRYNDGHIISPSMMRMALGIRFHTSGTPTFMLAAERKGEEEGLYASVGRGVEAVLSPYGNENSLFGVYGTMPVTLHFPGGFELSFSSSLPFTSRGVSGSREEYEILEGSTEFGTFAAPFYAIPRINRLSSLETGYHAEGDRFFSIRPALRYTWADMELWDLEAQLEDGTSIDPGEDSCEIMGRIHWLGASIEGRVKIGSLTALHLASSASFRLIPSDEAAAATPLKMPTIEGKYADWIYTLSATFTMAM